MKKWGIFLLFLSSIYFSCKQKNAGANSADGADTTKFFQVSKYLESEIKKVNETPYYIYELNVVDGKKDSTPINTSIFNQVSAQFLKPDINDDDLKKYYTENIFQDQTTNSFTITYSTKNKELELQNVEILVADDGKTVKRIFMRKFLNYSDSSAIEQLSWKSNESFQINRVVQLPDNKETSHQTTVVWNQKG